jgi:hypothetical protein
MIASERTKVLASFVALLVVSSAGPCYSRTTHVRIDTARWLHYPGYLLFTYTTSIPDSVPLKGENRVCIRNFRHDGQMGQDETSGGVSGGTYSALASQPSTWVIDPDDVPEILGGKGRYRHNEVMINFAKRYYLDLDAVWLGNFIDFDLELPDLGYLPADGPPDALTATFLNRDGAPAFSTGDPLGGNALIVCAPQRGTQGWQIEAFTPAQIRRGFSGAEDTVVVHLTEPPPSAGEAVHPLHVPPEIRSVARQQGFVWIEYAIPFAVSRVQLRVIDGSGYECYRREIGHLSPGIYGNEWPDGRGPSPAPGRYRVTLEVDGKLIEKSVDL